MIIELTDTEIAHIKRALESFYDNDDTGWCTCCESIATKLGFPHEPPKNGYEAPPNTDIQVSEERNNGI